MSSADAMRLRWPWLQRQTHSMSWECRSSTVTTVRLAAAFGRHCDRQTDFLAEEGRFRTFTRVSPGPKPVPIMPNGVG